MIFRGQSLSDDDLIRFSSHFGECEKAPIGDSVLEQDIPPEITVVSNVMEDGKPIGFLGTGELTWHTDMSYIEVPPTFSLLHSRVIPEEGGDTSFCSQVMAAKALPVDLREKVRKLSAKHDSTYGSSGQIRPGMTPPASPVEALGQVHPILRKVPTTGEEAIYLGRRTNGYIIGLPLEESEALLDELWAHSTKPEFCYRHKWREGQVIAWDNRMLLHMRYPSGRDVRSFHVAHTDEG